MALRYDWSGSAYAGYIRSKYPQILVPPSPGPCPPSIQGTTVSPKQTWVRSPARSKANLLTLGCGEGKYSVYCKAPNVGPSKENGQLMRKRPKLPNGFQGSVLFIYLCIYLFIFGCAGSSVRARAFSSCGKWEPLFIAVRRPLFIAVRGPFTIAAPPVAGHRLQTRRLSSCGSRVQLLRGMWDLPRPGLEPVSPALAGRFSTTAPPGKPPGKCF